MLRPALRSHIPQWHGVEVWPQRDSTALPTRADQQSVHYMDMVNHDHAGGMGQGEVYTVEAMAQVQEVLEKNQGGLELYCNATMRHVAMYGGLPAVAPARLEDVVDRKKTGADVSGVKEWCYEDTRAALARGDRVPRRLLGRLARERGRDELALDPPPVLTGAMDGHWLDRFDREWKGHIRQVERIRDRLMSEARPPDALFASVAQDPEAREVGARFNQLYATTVKRLQRKEFGGREREMSQRVQQEVAKAMYQSTTEGRRGLLLKWEFEKAWRTLAEARGNGAMGETEYAEAVALAHKSVEGLDDEAMVTEVQARLTRQVARRLEAEARRGLSRVGLDEVRETMEQFLSQWSEERQRAVLRGAMASVFLSERRKVGADADGVWLMGRVEVDGTRAAGIANRTIEALGAIGVIGIPFRRVLEDVLEATRY